MVDFKEEKMAEVDKLIQKELIGVGNQIRAYGILDGKLIQTKQFLNDMLMFEHDATINNSKARWMEFKEHLQKHHDRYKREQKALFTKLDGE